MPSDIWRGNCREKRGGIFFLIPGLPNGEKLEKGFICPQLKMALTIFTGMISVTTFSGTIFSAAFCGTPYTLLEIDALPLMWFVLSCFAVSPFCHLLERGDWPQKRGYAQSVTLVGRWGWWEGEWTAKTRKAGGRNRGRDRVEGSRLDGVWAG